MTAIENNEKTEKVILYIANKLKDEPNYGSVMLNKILYFVDHISYLKYDTSITSFKYIKQKRGPTPAPSEFLPLIMKLVNQKRLRIESKERLGYIQKRFIADETPELDTSLSGQEVALIDGIISECSKYSGNDLSNITHNMLAWQIAEPMQELPPFTFLLSAQAVTDSDIKWSKTQIAAHESFN